MIVAVALKNEYGDRRSIELDVKDGMTGSKAAAEAVRIANENNPPAFWPAGVPCGTWEFAHSFKRVPA